MHHINKMVFKLSGAFLLLILATAIPIGWFSVSEQEKLVKNYVDKTNDAFANFIASHVLNNLSKTRLKVEMLSHLPSFQNPDPQEIQKKIDELIQKEELFASAVFYDHRKQVLASSGDVQIIPDLDHLFSRTILHKYGMSLFDENTKDPEGVDPQFRVLVCNDEKIVGAIIVQLKMDVFRKKLSNIKAFLEYTNEYASIYLLDERKRVISQSGTTQKIPPTLLLSQNSFVKDLQDYYGSFETPPWQVVFVPKGSAFDNIVNFRMTFFKFVIFFILLASTLAVFVAGKITYPLQQLVRHTETIAAGNLDSQVTVSSDDEIGELADKFDEMRLNLRDYQNHLKRKITELQTLYHVGSIVSRELEYNTLLKTVLDTVVDVMAAEKGSIMIHDPKSETMKIAMAKGLRQDVVRKTVLISGESVAGHVFQTQQPMLVLDTMKDQDFARLKKKSVQPGTMLSVPLISKDKSLGVINISKSMPYSFDEYDLSLFQAIANVCATAIDNARLYKMAITDEMTGLYVRRFFYQNITRLLDRSHDTFALIMLDVDHFKSVNDIHGHATGDAVLIHVAKTIASSVRDFDIPCRLGGEEFAVICPNQTALEAKIPAERIRQKLESTPFELPSGQNLNVTISIGISAHPKDGKTVAELYEASDKALYYSKQHGRNLTTLHEEVVSLDSEGLA